ncbi:MAG: hypothetical protein ACRDPX_06260 [Gaiellaceae bacterium]
MGLKGWLLSAAAAAAIALAVVFAVSTRDGDENPPADELVVGPIYSTDRGDPIDVDYGVDESGMGCIYLRGLAFGVGGIPYGAGPRCFDLEEVEQGGTYQVLLPASTKDPALVVGVMPAGATGAKASGVGWRSAQAEISGRWFLASLEPAAPDESNLDDFRVRFEY